MGEICQKANLMKLSPTESNFVEQKGLQAFLLAFNQHIQSNFQLRLTFICNDVLLAPSGALIAIPAYY